MFEELIRAVGHSGTEQKRMKDTDYKLIVRPSWFQYTLTALNRITALKNALMSVYFVILGSVVPVPVMIIHQYGLLLGKSANVAV